MGFVSMNKGPHLLVAARIRVGIVGAVKVGICEEIFRAVRTAFEKVLAIASVPQIMLADILQQPLGAEVRRCLIRLGYVDRRKTAPSPRPPLLSKISYR